MKKFIAIALVLVLVLGLCATAFADYYPTVKFSTKNKSFKYGKAVTLKIKCYQGTGPFNKVLGDDYEWIWRAGVDVYAKKGSKNTMIMSKNFTKNPMITEKIKYGSEKYSKAFAMPAAGKIHKYKLSAISFYRPTSGYTVYNWVKYKTVYTNMYIYR